MHKGAADVALEDRSRAISKRRGAGVLALAFVCALSGCAQGGATASSSASDSASAAAAATTEKVTISFDRGIAREGSMAAMEAKKGGGFVVPRCTFTYDGYDFTYWIDEAGKSWKPGDTLKAEQDKTLTAHWEIKDGAASSPSSATPADTSASNTSAAGATGSSAAAANTSAANGSATGGTDSSAAAVNGSAAAPSNANGSAAATDPSSTFPRRWSGTYTGTSSYVNTPDHHILRAVAFDITSMSPDGSFEGTCYVGAYESGPGETYGTCAISGNVDWDTGEVHMQGTYWIDQGGLGDLREYSGTVDFGGQHMEGSAWDVGTGLYETPWSVSAVDTISITQKGSTVTIG